MSKDNSKKTVQEELAKKKATENLEEQFQQLGKDTKAPEDLKKEVFSTLDTLNLFADIADLFTVKFSMTEIEALGFPKEEDLIIEKPKEIKENTKKVDDSKDNNQLNSVS